jgi:hypothetical protein
MQRKFTKLYNEPQHFLPRCKVRKPGEELCLHLATSGEMKWG